MIDINGEVIIELTCDKCGKQEIKKHFIELDNTTLLEIPMPDGWRKKWFRAHKQIWCNECYECFRKHD